MRRGHASALVDYLNGTGEFVVDGPSLADEPDS